MYLRILENLFSPLHQRMALLSKSLQCRRMWEEAEYEQEFSTRREWINRIDQKFYEGLFHSQIFGGFLWWFLFVKTETFTNFWKVKVMVHFALKILLNEFFQQYFKKKQKRVKKYIYFLSSVKKNLNYQNINIQKTIQCFSSSAVNFPSGYG